MARIDRSGANGGAGIRVRCPAGIWYCSTVGVHRAIPYSSFAGSHSFSSKLLSVFSIAAMYSGVTEGSAGHFVPACTIMAWYFAGTLAGLKYRSGRAGVPVVAPGWVPAAAAHGWRTATAVPPTPRTPPRAAAATRVRLVRRAGVGRTVTGPAWRVMDSARRSRSPAPCRIRVRWSAERQSATKSCHSAGRPAGNVRVPLPTAYAAAAADRDRDVTPGNGRRPVSNWHA